MIVAHVLKKISFHRNGKNRMCEIVGRNVGTIGAGIQLQ